MATTVPAMKIVAMHSFKPSEAFSKHICDPQEEGARLTAYHFKCGRFHISHPAKGRGVFAYNAKMAAVDRQPHADMRAAGDFHTSFRANFGFGCSCRWLS